MYMGSKVMRLNQKNQQYIEEVRQLFAKVKFIKDIYWDDNRILTMALTNLILDFKEYAEPEQTHKALKDIKEL